MAAQPDPLTRESPDVVIRRATPDDAEVCGEMCFEAFATLANKHNFPPDFPAPERAIHVLSMMFSHPSFFCVVAEQDGKVVGSNCLDERTPIAGVGPITIHPASQNRSVGRQLMEAVMARAAEKKFAGVRPGTGGLPQSLALAVCQARLRGARAACLHAGRDTEDSARLPHSSRRTARYRSLQ